MKLAVLGTGIVGRTLGTAWVQAGHHVVLGSRTVDNEVATRWRVEHGGRNDTFSSAAAGAEVIVNATPGTVSVEVFAGCGDALDGKIVLDAANPLDFSKGFPPRLTVCNDDSLAEQLQRNAPAARIVKALNTLAAEVMVAPSSVPGDHVVPICGHDEAAKETVRTLLTDLGWRAEQLLDLGDLSAARGMEMWLPLWLRVYGHVGHPMFNLALPVSPDPAPRR